MRRTWLTLVDRVLTPARPALERCLEERARHLAERQAESERRAHALADCERRIEAARAEVFAASDGIVTSRMTDLEREWRRLARRDPDAGLMDLWARIAPASWIDRKRWRDSPPAGRVDAAVALASDPAGVDRAEAAARALRAALAAWGVELGARIAFCPFDEDRAVVEPLLSGPLEAARLAASEVAVERASRLEREVQARADARLPERSLLSRDLATAAFLDEASGGLSLAGRPDPTAPLVTLWEAGYTILRADGSGIVIEIPPLAGDAHLVS